MIIKDLKYCFAYESSSIKSCFINLEKSTKQIIFVVKAIERAMKSRVIRNSFPVAKIQCELGFREKYGFVF